MRLGTACAECTHMAFRFRSSRVLELTLLLAVGCGATADATSDGESALFGNYTTTDANNRWTHGENLATYALGQEHVLAEDAALFAQFDRDVRAIQEGAAARNGGVARGFHAKAHACVKGTFHVHVPAGRDDLRVGLFAEDLDYPVYTRFSNGVGFSQSDKSADVRGLALKVVGTPGSPLASGKKILAGQETATTQDFLMTNGATTPAPDSEQFVRFGKAMSDAMADGGRGGIVGPIEALLETGGYLLRPANTRVREYLLHKALPDALTHGSMLGEQFWTGGALALGIADGDPLTAAARGAFKATAIAGELDGRGRCVPVGRLPRPLDASYFRTDLTTRLAGGQACIDFQIQLQRDPSKQPIEDTSVEWRERDTPFVSVAHVTIPAKSLGSAEANAEEAACNELGFTPWHALEQHRPLGNIMRARKPVYEGSRERRGGVVEPRE